MNAAAPHASTTNVLIAGCGYVGRRLARRMQGRYQVSAVVRTAHSARSLAAMGVDAAALDLDGEIDGARLPGPEERAAIVYLAPPPPVGESDLRIGRFLQLIAQAPSVFVYMSTTGVYGDAAGGLVDETSPLAPRTARARRRVSAEEMTRVWCTERCVRRVVLRAPGVYGPGRLPLARLRRGEAVLRPEDAGPGNRIHVDDLVAACLAAVDNPEARGIYPISDGAPISTTAFMELLARLAGLAPPPHVSLEEAQLTFSAERLSFLGESRRVSNQRMIRDLGASLRYGDVEEGLRASLAEQQTQGAGRAPQAG
ncbi:MAG: NAD-dependent epimerase/dehydratase family protein [Steroidobacteraceae bacterium]|nr:NAD-dependent epimerase/dehydratase family protein [Steroidobacteraceae bacterium]